MKYILVSDNSSDFVFELVKEDDKSLLVRDEFIDGDDAKPYTITKTNTIQVYEVLESEYNQLKEYIELDKPDNFDNVLYNVIHGRLGINKRI